MATLHCTLDARFQAAQRARPQFRPDDAEVRAAIARDLATLDARRRRRYDAKLSRLMHAAEASRRAVGAAQASRRARRIAMALFGLTAAAGFAAAALALAHQPLAVRLALAAAAICAGLIGLDIALRRNASALEDLARHPAEVAMNLHRTAFATLSYAADLPKATTRSRRA